MRISVLSSSCSENRTISDQFGNSDIPSGKPAVSLTLTALFSATPKRVREAIYLDIKECCLSREQIALELSRVTGAKYTLPMIDAFVARTKPHRFPAEIIPAWIQVTRSHRLLEVLCAEIGLSLSNSEDRGFAELGRMQLRTEKLKEQLWERA